MAITTYTEYKAYANISSAVTDEDTFFTTIIGAAQGYAERWCDRSFDYATFTEVHDGEGSDVIVLKNRPVVAITSVATVDAAGTALVTWSATGYTFDASTGELILTPTEMDTCGLRVPSFLDQRKSTKVVYTAGYGNSPGVTTPADLKLAIWRIVDVLRRSDKTKISSSNTYAALDTDDMIRTILEPYRRDTR